VLYGTLAGKSPYTGAWWQQRTMDDRARRLVCTVLETESDIWTGTNFDAEE